MNHLQSCSLWTVLTELSPYLSYPPGAIQHPWHQIFTRCLDKKLSCMPWSCVQPHWESVGHSSGLVRCVRHHPLPFWPANIVKSTQAVFPQHIHGVHSHIPGVCHSWVHPCMVLESELRVGTEDYIASHKVHHCCRVEFEHRSQCCFCLR